DLAGVEAFQLEGLHQVRAANLYGCERRFSADADTANETKPLDNSTPERRDIDILFVGNLNAAVQRERMSWMMRLARLGKRWRVAIRAGVFGDTYRQLLRRAKIAFSYVEYPRGSRRHSEAAAAGA